MNHYQGRRESASTSDIQPRLSQAAALPAEATATISGPPAPSRQIISQQSIGGYQWLMGVFFVIHFFYLLYLQTRGDVADNRGLRVTSDVLVFIGALICTVTCIYVARKFLALRRTSTDILVRRAWLAVAFLGCSAAVYTIGQGIWTGYEAIYPTSQFPYPAVYDFFYLAVYPFSWIGLAFLVPRNSTAAGRARLVLDAATAVLSFLAVTWYFILGPTIAALTGSSLEKFVSLAYPLGDLSLCVSAAILLFGTASRSVLSAMIGRLALGVTVLAATDTLYGYFQLQGVYHTGFLQDIGWPMSWLFIGWAMLTYLNDLANVSAQRHPAEAMASRLNRTGAATRAIAPMVIALLTCGLLLLVVGVRNTAPLIQVVVVCAGLFLLPLVRQALTLIDNLMLNERLRVALGQSQQAFQQSQQELLTTASQAELYEELRTGIHGLQKVHAALARGDMGVRAQVAGPLSPVAQSLNLLIERMNRWSQVLQQNRIMEHEAGQLTYELEKLGEGQLVLQRSTRPSAFPTGAALSGSMSLQKRLQWRFQRLNDTAQQLTSHTHTLVEVIARLRQALLDRPLPQQQVEQLVGQLERGLANNQNILQELQQRTDVYLDLANPELLRRSSADNLMIQRNGMRQSR